MLNFLGLSGGTGTKFVIQYTMNKIYWKTTMAPIYLIPLLMSCIAVWVSLGNPQWKVDDLPKLLAIVIGIICMIWFFVATPWFIKLSLILLVLILGNSYLEKSFKTDE